MFHEQNLCKISQTVMGVGFLSFLGDNHLKVAGSILTAGILNTCTRLWLTESERDPRGYNKGHSSKFHEGFRVRQTPEEGRRTYQPKRCGNNNKDEDSSSKTLNDKNQSNHYLQSIWFWLVWFYDISAIVSYLIPNPAFTYILNI